MSQNEPQESKQSKRISVWTSLLLFVVGFLLFAILYSVIAFELSSWVVGDKKPNETLLPYIIMEIGLLLAVFTPALILLRLNRSPFSDLGLSVKGRSKDFLYGMLFAILLYGIGFSLSLLFGVVEVTGFNFDLWALAGSLFFYLLVSLTEETLVRGFVLGHLLHTRLNKFLSLFLSSLFFGALHFFNPNLSILPMVNLILAGMLLGASYLYTRNLCFPISLHLFWNWIQGPVLGYEVSGNEFTTSMLTLHLPKENLINGGAFGFEGSIICTVLMIIFTALIIWWGEKREAIANI